ncbi:unnamed protein product, partial [Closterium sp. NIES-54]
AAPQAALPHCPNGTPPLAAHAPPFAARRADLSSPRVAPAASTPPLQPARRPLAARLPPLQSARRPLAARSLPLQPARCPLAARSPPLQPFRRSPPLQPARRPLAARSPPLRPARRPHAARSPPTCGPLAAPCSLRAALWQPACRPLQPARRPLQPTRHPFAARSPPLAACSPPLATPAPPAGSPLAAPLQPACHPLAAHSSPLAALAPPSGSPLTALLQPAHPPFADRVPARLLPARLLPALLLPTLLCAALLAALALCALLACYSSGSASPCSACYGFSECTHWLTRDAAARLAVRNHLPLAEHAHFGQHKTAKTMYDDVVARYSSPATAALGILTVYCPTCFPSFRDHFLALDPTTLTVDLLEQHLLVAETDIVSVGATRGTPRTPFFEGCSPSPLAPSYASAAAVDILCATDVEATSAVSGKHRSSKGKGGKGGGSGNGVGGGGGSEGDGGSGGGGSGGSGGGSGGFGGGSGGGGSGGGGGGGGCGTSGSGGSRGGSVQRGGSGGGQRQQHAGSSTLSTTAGQTCGKFHSQHHCFSRLDDAWCAEFGDEAECPRCAELLRSGVDILALDYDAILAAMYDLSVSAECDCYRCEPPDPGLEAAALGAIESALPGTAPAAALHTFTLDSGASRCFFRNNTTLTPLFAPVPVKLADPSGGPVLACSSTVLPCPSVPFGSLSGLHIPSFSTNLMSTAALQDAMVTTTTTGGQRVLICTFTRTGRHLATFTRRPGSSPVAPPSSCRLLSHQTLLWHHRLGHPSLPRLRGNASLFLKSSQVFSSPPALTCPALPSLRRRAAARCSSLLLVSLDDCSPADSPHG